MANLGDFKLIYPTESAEKNEEYKRFLETSHEVWEDFTTGRRRKNNHNQTSTNWNNEPGTLTQRQLENSEGKPIWKGSGTVKDYVPAWERSFKKSMIAKQQRMEQAKANLMTVTPVPASEKHPQLSGGQEPVSPQPVAKHSSAPPIPGPSLPERPDIDDLNDSPIKFASMYGHEPQC